MRKEALILVARFEIDVGLCNVGWFGSGRTLWISAAFVSEPAHLNSGWGDGVLLFSLREEIMFHINETVN